MHDGPDVVGDRVEPAGAHLDVEDHLGSVGVVHGAVVSSVVFRWVPGAWHFGVLLGVMVMVSSSPMRWTPIGTEKQGSNWVFRGESDSSCSELKRRL